MSRKLLRQIGNEWRSNMWLATELLVVSVVLWYIVDYMFVTVATLRELRGFDVEHCYLLDFERLTDKSPDFHEYESGDEYCGEVAEVLERLRRRPEVEAASIGVVAHPYNTGNMSVPIGYDSISASGLMRMVSPDFVKVFRFEGVAGETPDQLAGLLREGKLLMTDQFFADTPDGVPVSALVGQKVHLYGDTANTMTVGASIKPVRYTDYTQGYWCTSSVMPLTFDKYGWVDEFCVRIRPDMDRNIVESLMADSESQFRVGNLYLNSVHPFVVVRDNCLRNSDRELRDYAVGMSFLLLNIFLGLLGTFWFRTRQRVSEIAIRKVSGATDADIFRRLIGEGLLLLTIVTPIAVVVDINLSLLELNAMYDDAWFQWWRIGITAAIVYGLMAVMIVAGILLPARKAMRIDPSEALHDE